ncbi:endolytic transglycosylase MltG [Paenibacillus jiagnxiensis]|uniref:endolytic transglycosylase MltG n=1 Tax=Paenibacillus jiagnxiensis TaxID=3228926 RepID=UPI0033AE47BE
MLKNRTFMLGMGTGMIAGALLLQLAIIGQGQSKAADAPRELTREEVEVAAQRFGLQVSDSTDPLMTEEQWRQKVIEKGSQTPEEPAAPKSADAASEPKAPQQLQTGKPETAVPQAGNHTVQAAEQPAAPEATPIRYRIVPGSSLNSVAEGLQKAGVIENADAFQKAANEQKINTKIRSGTYSFREGETFNSIITKITTPPK